MFLTLATFMSSLSIVGHGVYSQSQPSSFVTYANQENRFSLQYMVDDLNYLFYGSTSNDYLTIRYTNNGSSIDLFKINPHAIHVQYQNGIGVERLSISSSFNFTMDCSLSYRGWIDSEQASEVGCFSTQNMSLVFANTSESSILWLSNELDEYSNTDVDSEYYALYSFTFSYLDEEAYNSILYGNGSESFDTGYNVGYSNGFNEGYDEGSSEGFDNGYDSGYAQGVADTEAEGTASYTFMGLVTALADTPIVMLHGMFDFEIFGMNILSIVLSMLTALLVLFIVKKIVK